MPNNIENNVPLVLASDIVIRLNGIRDEKYATKIAYEVFRTIGHACERKYQKDVNDSLDILNPLLSVMDEIFNELSKNVKIMAKPVKDGFFHAYQETRSLEFLEELDGHELGKAVKWLNQLPKPNTSSIDYMINEGEWIKKSEWLKNKDSETSNLTALSIAKRKLMKQLDWIYCSFDKNLLNEYNKMERVNVEIETLPEITNTNNAYLLNSSLKSLLTKKFNNFTNDERWENGQELSTILKSNSSKKDTLYIDSKKIPDANDLQKIEQVLEYLQKDSKLTPKSLSMLMKVTPRMASYYLEASEMLKIVKRSGKYYYRTILAEKYYKYSKDDKLGIIEQSIREMPITKTFMLYMKNSSKTSFTHKDVTRFLEKTTDLSYTTCFRRASTLTAWFCDGGIANKYHGRYSIKHNEGQTTLLEFQKK